MSVALLLLLVLRLPVGVAFFRILLGAVVGRAVAILVAGREGGREETGRFQSQPQQEKYSQASRRIRSRFTSVAMDATLDARDRRPASLLALRSSDGTAAGGSREREGDCSSIFSSSGWETCGLHAHMALGLFGCDTYTAIAQLEDGRKRRGTKKSKQPSTQILNCGPSEVYGKEREKKGSYRRPLQVYKVLVANSTALGLSFSLFLVAFESEKDARVLKTCDDEHQPPVLLAPAVWGRPPRATPSARSRSSTCSSPAPVSASVATRVLPRRGPLRAAAAMLRPATQGAWVPAWA